MTSFLVRGTLQRIWKGEDTDSPDSDVVEVIDPVAAARPVIAEKEYWDPAWGDPDDIVEEVRLPKGWDPEDVQWGGPEYNPNKWPKPFSFP